MCGAEGWITYTIKCKSKFNHAGYIWSLLKKILPEEHRVKIRGLKPFKSMDGVVFDFPEDAHKDFENIIFNDKYYGVSYTLMQAEELPELLESEGQSQGYSTTTTTSSTYNRNGRSSYPTRNRSDRIDIFVGNMPRDTEESKLRQWIQNNGVDTSDVEIRLVLDKETNTQKGFGFISTYDKEILNKILSLNGKQYNHRALKINEATKR
jgi:hypothetical protein